MSKINVIITVDSKYLNEINQVTNKLLELGLVVSHIHSNTGIIVGIIENSNLQKITNVLGVIAVEKELINDID